jgi:hypothetical protein
MIDICRFIGSSRPIALAAFVRTSAATVMLVAE